jgi:glycosyltransferase involved in cell wall biosynthesis
VSEIEDYLQAADVGLFTSDLESFCLSILEAMCFGCPSVAAAVGGIPEVVVSGSSGILVQAGDVDAFARATESLIGDPALRATLGAAAKIRARELFSADAILARYEQLYRRVCSAEPR